MSRPHVWATLGLQLKASPAKSGLLGGLAVILIVVATRQFWKGPRTAGAAVASVSGSLGAGNPATAGPSAPRPADAGRLRRPRLPLPPLTDRLARNPFETDWSRFALIRGDPTASHDEPLERREAAAQTGPLLVLELTLTAPGNGGPARAVISGQSVRVGDRLSNYRVVSIVPGAVVLNAGDDERIELRMR